MICHLIRLNDFPPIYCVIGILVIFIDPHSLTLIGARLRVTKMTVQQWQHELYTLILAIQ